MSLRRLAGLAATIFALADVPPAVAQLQPVVPRDQRGQLDAERSGFHDAANIRTVFWNFGMVGDYPRDPGNVDLSVFHSAEVPKGSGMNYSDGITPFVLAKVKDRQGQDFYMMETGFRERQAISPYTNLVMRFEPRPGYFQPDPLINRGRSPAISSDRRTWPDRWPDKLIDPDDPGWPKSWNGYFGKRAAADQESYVILDDDFYDAFNYRPDTRDSTRHGLGLRIAQRGFQWANPQAGNVIFWHYDITNESTTDYPAPGEPDNIIFGLYMDSGVGGSALSCDGIFESDDDNAYFDKSSGLNLVYTWDVRGHGVDLRGNCSPTGYLGYAYLETPGNQFNGIDDDGDGIRDERREGGPGLVIDGQDAIRAYVAMNYDTTAFQRVYGRLEDLPAYRVGRWWTGDEDMDWTPEFDDVGGDGVDGTGDVGERDGIPTLGEPNFDRTDLNESDQIGLTGFKMNRIRAGQGNPDPTADGIVFYTDSQNWPERLYQKFTDPFAPARFDSALAANYNIGFLFASGPFKLRAGQTERFSLALAYGTDLQELRTNVGTVQQIYNANYQFAVPPPLPTVTAEAGEGYVRLSWDDVAERGVDPVTHRRDFEGYRIYRSTDPDFGDVQKILGSRGNPVPNSYKPFFQMDAIDSVRGNSRRTVDGISYYLGSETGITHTWTDSSVTNGQEYYYSVTAFDTGFEPEPFDEKSSTFPSENSVAGVSRTPRGGVVLPTNIVRVRPNAPALGYQGAAVTPAAHVLGDGVGTVAVQVVNSDLVRDGHLYKIGFAVSGADSLRAESYSLADSTTGEVFFEHGADLEGRGIGAIGGGLLPLVVPIPVVTPDSARSGYAPGSPTNTRIKFAYQPVLSPNLRRPGYPDSITIVFDDVVRDTGLVLGAGYQARPAKFVVIAHTSQGDQQLDFRFRDFDANGTLSRADESFDILTYTTQVPGEAQPTWRVQLDTLGQGQRGPIVPPRLGDVYELRTRKPLGAADVFVFTGQGERVDAARAAATPLQPYVVPNPYIEAASFEPSRFAISGRGERRLEFRGLPRNAVIRIYTVRGDLVQTLRHDGSDAGFVPWNLRTKDNLDVAPGLYVFQVEAPGMGTSTGKFGIIK